MRRVRGQDAPAPSVLGRATLSLPRLWQVLQQALQPPLSPVCPQPQGDEQLQQVWEVIPEPEGAQLPQTRTSRGEALLLLTL